MLDKLTQWAAIVQLSRGVFDSDGKLKTADVSYGKEGIEIHKLSTIPLKEYFTEENVKRLDISNLAGSTMGGAVIATGLKASEVLVRPLEIELTKKKDIDAVIEFQAEPLIPYPPEEAVISYQILEQTDRGTRTTILATKKETLQGHLNEFASYEIDPEVVSCTPVALAQFSHHFAPSKIVDQPLLVIHMGYVDTLCILAQGGSLISNHSISKGAANLVRALKRETEVDENDAWQQLLHMDFTEITEESNPQLKSAIDELIQEITRTIFALAKHSKIQEVAEILLTGKGGTLTYMPITLSVALKSKVSVPESKPNTPSVDLQDYAIPIGLGIAGLQEDPMNFRTGDFMFQNPWKHTKFPIGLYLVLCVLVTLSVFFLGSALNGNKLDALKQDYIKMLQSVGRPFVEIETKYKEANPFLNIPELAPEEHLSKMSADDLMNRLEFLQGEINTAPRLYALMPDAPRASDVLAWLASHTSVVGIDGKAKINITGFNYTMVKRPDDKKKNEKYQVRVDLDFKVSTPTAAREFHDALIAPNEMVDPKTQVKWSLSGDTYRTSFFLKNRAPRIPAGEE